MDNITKANVNLHAVLSNLPQLCRMDENARSLVSGEKLTMELAIKNGAAAHIVFTGDGCEFYPKAAENAEIRLSFKNAEHLLKMFDMFDGKANPGIKKGLSKVKFLTGNFTGLTDRLSYFLRPEGDLMQEEQYFTVNTWLTFHTAFYALCEIANSDEIGKINAADVPEGIVNITVDGGPALHIVVDANHRFTPHDGAHEKPRAMMRFYTLQAAADILNGVSNIYTELGKGSFAIGGFVPMIDNAGRILNLVEVYLR